MGLGFTTLSFCALSLVTEGEARRYYLIWQSKSGPGLKTGT